MSNIEKALKAASETKALNIGLKNLNEVPKLFKSQFPNKKAIIIADENTFKIAGEKIEKALKLENITQAKPFIFNDKDLYAEYGYVEMLINELKKHDAIPIAVGSGTINDLTKLSSHITNRRYLCVATAASMDGYTAFGASITADGAKQTFNCPAPQAVLADIDIISKAPENMTASGYADLFAKVTAGADWIVADALDVEPIDEQAWSIVQDGLPEALSDPDGAAMGNNEAIDKLIEGLMLGGFAMQWSKSSRPASGAEHQFSHLWNMEHHLNNGEHISHGFQVSIGMLAITAFYEQVLKTDMNSLDIKACCEKWPTLEQQIKNAGDMFKGTDFPEIGIQETSAKHISKEVLEKQLTLLKDNWSDIKERLNKQLIPYTEVKRRLELVGAPTEPEQIGISRERLKETFIKAQYIRRRFTVLDLAVRTGFFDQWLDGLFGENKIWDINKE